MAEAVPNEAGRAGDNDPMNKVDAVVAVGTTAAVALPAVQTAAVVVLKTIGFSAAGPVANTLAASWMSSTAVAAGGAVPAGSVYAGVQSAAMTLAVINPFAAVVGTVAGGYFVWRHWSKRRHA